MDDDIIDINCDPNKPREISLEHITTADLLLMDSVAKTPCTRAVNCDAYNMDLYFKKEFMQVTGSFKERGARFSLLLLSDKQKKIGVISASTGNHALALSYHGNQLDIPVTVVMPINTAPWKIEKCRSYNASVIIEGRDIAESRVIALVLAKVRQLEYINGFDHPHVLAGCGTLGFEILNQIPKIDAIIVPVGGGGLIAGMAITVKMVSPNTQIIGVELEKCPSLTRALENESPIYTSPNSSLAESLLVPTVGCNAYPVVAKLMDELVVVREAWVALAMLRLVEEEGCVVEGAGAVGLAAILAGQLNMLQMKRVVVLLTGCNTSTAAFGRALERGLFVERRMLPVDSDDRERVGGMLGLIDTISKLGIAVNDLLSETVWLKSAYKKEMENAKTSPHDLLHHYEMKNHAEQHPQEEPKQTTAEEDKEKPQNKTIETVNEDNRTSTAPDTENPNVAKTIERVERVEEALPHGAQEKVKGQASTVRNHKKLPIPSRKTSSKKSSM